MIHLMSTFVAVVDAGGFSEAGRRMGQPKSAVSRRIGELERQLGVRLLQRSTRAVQPTDIGQEFYQRCLRILADIDDATQLARRDQATPSGKLRVQLPVELGMHILGRFLVEFVRVNPSVSVEVELSNRQIDMIDEQYDLAIRIGIMPDSTLIARKILSIQRGFYASPTYLKQHGEPVTFEDLHAHDCLRFRTGYDDGDWQVTGPDGKAVIHPAGPVAVNNMSILQEAAICGLGIASLPHALCRKAVENDQLRQILPQWTVEDFDVFVLYPSRLHLSAKVRNFLDFFDKRLVEISAWMNTPVRIIRPPLWDDTLGKEGQAASNQARSA